MQYANFWKRTAAYLVDGIIYGVISSIAGQVIGLIIGISFGLTMSGQNEPPIAALIASVFIAFAIQLVCYVCYYVWPESSSWQATIGKKIFGLQVTDLNGQRISFWRSLGRNLGMIVSSIILCIGYLMCLWTDKKQCLHDQMANCLVIDTKPNEKQGCVIGAIIGFFALIMLSTIGGIILAISLPHYMQAVERARATTASSLTEQARTAQRLYKQAHGYYATTWNQLDFAPCSEETSALCQQPDFTLELESQGVAAQRKNNNSVIYRLFRAYDPSDTRRDLVCISKNEHAKSFCQIFINKLHS